MNSRVTILAATVLCAASAVPTARPLSNLERSAIQSKSDAHLGSLRAGAPSSVVALHADERETLRALSAKSAHLRGMRAGMTDHELTLIAVTALVVLVLVILL